MLRSAPSCIKLNLVILIQLFKSLKIILTEYWGIDELLMDPCCALKYYPDIELCVSEMNGEEKAKERQCQKEQDENFGTSRLGFNTNFIFL